MVEIAPFVSFYFVVVGLMAGSFINLAVDRVPRGESVVQPPSHCRSCGRRLNVVDLMPVLGYMIRGGRCATCSAPIGVTSPLIEAITGALMLLSIAGLGLWPGAAVGLALIALWGFGLTALAVRRARGEALG